MKRILSVAICSFSLVAFAQNDSGVSPTQGEDSSASQASASTVSSTAITNGAGQSYSVQQLADGLTELRRAIDRTLPAVTAANEMFSNSAPQSALGSALSGVLSAIRKDKNDPSDQAGNGGGIKLTNVLAALQGLLHMNTNAPAAPAIDPATLDRLVTLQKQLEPLSQTLQELNLPSTQNTIGSQTNQIAAPSPRPTQPSEGDHRLSPTGRSSTGNRDQ